MTRAAAARTLATVTALALLGDMFVYTVLPADPAAAGIGVTSLGVVLSVHRLIRLAINPVGGAIYDRLGRRGPFLCGMALATCATTGYLLASGLWPLLAARLVWGLAFSLISVGGLTIVLDVSSGTDRGRTVGLFQSLVNVGTLCALALAGVLGDLLGYRPALAVLTALTALGLLVAMARLAETRPPRPARHRSAMQSGHVTLAAAWRRLDRRLLAPMCLSGTVFLVGNGVLMSTLGRYLRTTLAAGAGGPAVPLASLTGALLALRKACMMAVNPAAGRLADGPAGRRGTTALGLLVAVSGFVLLARAGDLWLVVAGLGLTAIGEGLATPAVTAWAGDLTTPDRRGIVMGVLATANDLGGTLGPLAGYAVGARLGFAPAYALCAVAELAALTVLAITRYRRSAAPSAQ